MSPDKPAVSNSSQYLVGHCPGPWGNKTIGQNGLRALGSGSQSMNQGLGAISAPGAPLRPRPLAFVFLRFLSPPPARPWDEPGAGRFARVESASPGRSPRCVSPRGNGCHQSVWEEWSGPAVILNRALASGEMSWVTRLLAGACTRHKVMGPSSDSKLKATGHFRVRLTNPRKYSSATNLGIQWQHKQYFLNNGCLQL